MAPEPAFEKPTASLPQLSMKSGVGYFATDYSMDARALGRLVEDRGQESLFLPEHTHIPSSRQTPFPPGGELPLRYSHTYDPFVALAAVAAVTTRLRIGTGVCLIAERDPIITAKAVASLDCISDGRFEFGVGAGWNREEMINHGIDPRSRMRLMGERIEAMKAIWQQDEASFSGDFVNFKGIWSWPKPVQLPHPPVLIGGNGPTVLDRVLAHADAWFPNHWGGQVLGRFEELLSRADRKIDLMVMGVPADPVILEEYARAGCTRVVHWLPSDRQSTIEQALDGWERAFAQFLGA